MLDLKLVFMNIILYHTGAFMHLLVSKVAYQSSIIKCEKNKVWKHKYNAFNSISLAIVFFYLYETVTLYNKISLMRLI